MPKNQEYIKNNNIELVLNTLVFNKHLSRIELAKMTKLSATSITRVTQFLIENGYIIEEKSLSSGLGRNPSTLSIIPNSAYTIGVELLKDTTILSVLNLERDVVLTHRESISNNERSLEILAKEIFELSKKLFTENNIDYKKVVSVGVAIPGIVNNNEGIVNYSTQLKWENAKVGEIFEKIFNKPIIVENDTKARMIAKENNRVFLKNSCVVGLFIGEGVSAVGISESHIVRGVNNAAGEVGHIITNSKGIKCDCGSNGCLQTNLANKFLLCKARKNKKDIKDVKEILDFHKNGEDWAIEIIEDFKKSFLLVLDILQHCYNPSLIVVSGEMLDSFNGFLSEFIKEFELINRTTSTKIEILISKNDKSEPSIGVGIISFNSLFKAK